MIKFKDIRSLAKKHPPLAISVGFFSIAVFLALILTLPVSIRNGEEFSFSKSFFTIMSAMSGTGLVVEKTGIFFTGFGQWIILCAMQIGGIGVVTFGIIISFIIAKRLGLTTKILAISDYSENASSQAWKIGRFVIVVVFIVQLIVCLIFLPSFLSLNYSFPNALWHSWFYSVSAFNNAGFDLTEGDFPLLSSTPAMSFAFFLAITAGALGFLTIMNVYESIKKRKKSLISFNTKIVLSVYFIMDAIIILWYFLVEWGNSKLFEDSINQNPIKHISGLFFAAITARASGFSIIDDSNLTESTRLINEIWMFIGAGPVATTAGIRVTTFAILLFAVWAEIKGYREVSVFKRRPPNNSLRIAIVIFTVSILICVLTSFILEVTIPNVNADEAIYDVISAFTNTGGTLGLPALLNDAWLSYFGVLMFVGRIGPMTIAAALLKKERSNLVRFPEEAVILG